MRKADAPRNPKDSAPHQSSLAGGWLRFCAALFTKPVLGGIGQTEVVPRKIYTLYFVVGLGEEARIDGVGDLGLWSPPDVCGEVPKLEKFRPLRGEAGCSVKD
jgi:hypothetical protein